MSEQVDVFVRNSTPLQNPIEDVLVQVYSQDGSTFYTQSTTDVSGQVGFLLPANIYSLRFFKNHVGFSQPQLMVVLANPLPPQDPNEFDVIGEVFVLPIAQNPRLCQASGFFKDVNGGPKQFLDLHFISRFSPLLLEGDAVVTERQRIKTDENGYASITLIRFGQYEVTMEAREDLPRLITVPDSPSANLPYLLFPVVDRVGFSPTGPYALEVGEDLVVTPTVLDTAGVELEGAATLDVQWASSDDSVAAVLISTDFITLRGVAAGTAELQATRRDDSIIRIPNTAIYGVPQTIVVT